MEKTICVDGKNVKLKTTGATLIRYKSQFHKDALAEIFKLNEALNSEDGRIKIEAFDTTTFQELVWIMAKTADPEIPDFLMWLDSFESFPLLEILPEAMDLIYSFLQTSKKK